LAAFMVGIGSTHFLVPDWYAAIVPAALPYPMALVFVSGVCEIAGGIGLLVPRVSRAAAWGLVALYVAVFPANVNMAINHIAPGGHSLPAFALWARLPFQLVFIAWAYRYTRAAQ
jgi:uncharacterized membrane protein